MRGWKRLGIVVAMAAVMHACGGTDAQLEATVATGRAVRGTLAVADANGAALSAGPTARVPVGGSLAASEDGLARVAIDTGPQLLLGPGAHVSFPEDTRVAVDTGSAYFDVMSGDAVEIGVAGATLRASDAGLSVEVVEGGADVYVVRGEISQRLGEARSIVHAGERLAIRGESATTSAETLWRDWTGGLVRTGPSDAASAPGVGTLEARVPDEVGQARWALVIRRLDVQVRIVGELAITEVQEVFFNPASETVEGLYRVSVPEGAVLERFAVDRNGRLVDGYVREEQQARAAYEAQVYRGSTDDPALLAWDAPGRYRARIYPIAPGEVRRIAIRYAEWLPRAYEGGPMLYRYPMAAGAGAPHVGELAFVADLSEAHVASVRAGLGATVSEGRVELRRSDFAPRSDLWVELVPAEADAQRAYRAAHAPPQRAPGSRAVVNEADERDYWYLPLRLPERMFASASEARGLDVVIVADVSAATDRAHLELGRSVAEAIAAHLGEGDRLSVVSSDLTIRAVAEGGTELGEVSAARVDALLDGLARIPAGGATDLGEAIAQAGALLDPSRNGAVVYIGDGAPTVGELGSEALLGHLIDQPHPIRLYAVGIGADANLDLLGELTHGGGLALRVEEQREAAPAALDILAHLSRPILGRVTVDVGSGVENVFPRVPVDVVRGEVLEVVGRVRDGVPTEIVVHGSFLGTDVEEHLAVTTALSDAGTDLRLRWASERLRQQLREGATREEIAELGTRYGLITPYTSYYVPSAREMAQMGALSGIFEHVDLVGPARARSSSLAEAAATILVGPLALTGCVSGSEPPSAASAPLEESEEQGAMGGRAVGNVTPVTAEPSVAVAPIVPREAAPPAPPGLPPATAVQMPSPVTAPTTAAAPAPDVAALRAQLAGDDAPNDGAFRDVLAGGAVTGTERLAETEGTGEGTIGLGDLGTLGHGSGGSGYGSGGRSGGAQMRAHRPAPSRIAGPESRRSPTHADRWADAEDGGGDASRARPASAPTADHTRQRCSDAADLSLDDRRALWSERLRQSDWVGSWVDQLRSAARDCEVRTARDRRAFVDVMIDRAGSLAQMINLYGYLGDGAARGYLRTAIFRRVRTPDDLRQVRGAFGGTFVDWVLVEQVLTRATTPSARLRALRGLIAQQPESFELRLRLLEELEVQHHEPELRRLAERLRADPLADVGVRTAIGELYLRLGDEDDARRTFSEIVEFAPMDELARRRLGDLYRAHGWYEDAYRQYETLATIRPDDPTVMLLLAQAAGGAGRVDEALRLEQRVLATAPPGSTGGIARVAQLWSSVRFAELRRNATDDEQRSALRARMHQSGVLRNVGELRVTLVWEHPDADVALWAGRPGTSVSRPEDLDAELGIEAFEERRQVSGGLYRIEVRRTSHDRVASAHARLVVVWNEGRDDEQVELRDLDLPPGSPPIAFAITDRNLTQLPSQPASIGAPPRGPR
ncbi:MAG: VIT domain-containing protein [Sandaracinus sp.]